MRIDGIDGGFVETIENGVVEKVVCMYDGTCTVYFYNKPSKELNVKCSSYNKQYGIPVSQDGSKLFIGSWEKRLGGQYGGLMAYDIDSGHILWKLTDGKIRSIFVYSNYLIVLKAQSTIFKIDIDSGVLLGQLKGSTMEHIFDIGFPYVYINALSGKQSVLHVDKMSVVKKYSPKVVNPSNSLSVLIQDVCLHENILTISGIEQESISTTIKDYLSNQKSFSRVVDAKFNIF